MMIVPPIYHNVRAAQGWLELGNCLEADRELNRIPPGLRVDPEVLEMRWQIHARMLMWVAALEISHAIRAIAPERPWGWIFHARSLHKLGRSPQAIQELTKAKELFPEDSTIPFDLACLNCELNRPDEAEAWLTQAMRDGGLEAISIKALKEPILKPLWSWVVIRVENTHAACSQLEKIPLDFRGKKTVFECSDRSLSPPSFTGLSRVAL